MKRILTIMLALISYTLSTQAQAVNLQEEQEDSVINVIGYFCKGDTMKYTYTDAVYKITQKDTITSSYYTRDCMIVVTDSTSKGYKLEMTPFEVEVADDSTANTLETKMNVAILKGFTNIKIKFHTDEFGTIEAIDNWREVRDLFLNGTRKAFDELYNQTPGIDSFMPRKNFENMIALNMRNEETVRECIEELPLLFDCHGKQFKIGTTEVTDSTTSLYPTKIKILASYTQDEEEGTEGDYTLISSSTTAIPPKDTKQLIGFVFQNLFSGELGKKGDAFVQDSLENVLKNDSMKIENYEKYYIFGNGWPAHMQTLKSSGFSFQKKIECKSIDWYYRSWKGYDMKEDEADKKKL